MRTLRTLARSFGGAWIGFGIGWASVRSLASRSYGSLNLSVTFLFFVVERTDGFLGRDSPAWFSVPPESQASASGKDDDDDSSSRASFIINMLFYAIYHDHNPPYTHPHTCQTCNSAAMSSRLTSCANCNGVYPSGSF